LDKAGFAAAQVSDEPDDNTGVQASADQPSQMTGLRGGCRDDGYSGFWFLVHGVWFMVLRSWFMVHGFWCCCRYWHVFVDEIVKVRIHQSYTFFK
jgi:hypothetical protein